MKLAIVTPWFGRKLKGGAEQQAWQVATWLAKRGHSVEVLTTCCRSHQDDWATNHLADGDNKEAEGFVVRRFRVDERDKRSFDRVCADLLNVPGATLKPGVSPVEKSDAEIFVNELIRSQSLLNYLTQRGRTYQNVILIPYLYGPIIKAAVILGQRAALQPCLHDEAYAYLPQVSDAFEAAGRLLFNSEGEKELALRLFGPGIWRKSYVVGEGIESATNKQPPENGASSLKLSDPFVLYLGRKDPGKNVPLLVRAFQKFKCVRPNSELKLVLAGHGAIESEGCDSIVDAGLVSNGQKEELLKSCLALVQPSTNESFSRVIMEAWRYGRPVGVHASCLATATAVRTSGGGWLAETEADWAELFTTVNRTSPAELAELGQKGLQYAGDITDWEKVMDRYEQALQPRLKTNTRAETNTPARSEVHQILPTMAFGDAISNHAIFIRDVLRGAGYPSNIYVENAEQRISAECCILDEAAIPASAPIIYHHSIGSNVTSAVVDHPGPKFLVYHNITPDSFFDPYRPDFADLLRAGREELSQLACHFPASAGVSRFNRDELAQHGFSNPSILPIAIEPDRWQVSPDRQTMVQLRDDRTNILFVGRISPNKKQDDLVEALKIYRQIDPSVRLILAGLFQEEDPYAFYLQELIDSSGLNDSVILSDCVDDAHLSVYYRCADLFWSMSEHEGFGVPLIEAMWFDIPVLAFKSSAVPETLGGAGLMFTEKNSFEELAALAHELITDRRLRQSIIDAQRQRRLEFLPERVTPPVLRIAAELTHVYGRRD